VPNYSVERVVRYVRLQDESKALLPHPLNPHKPIQPDWLAITHEIAHSPDPAHSSESFGLYFVIDDGGCLGFYPSDDFDITWADIHR